MKPCDICAYAAEHFSWPPGTAGTHCRSCHRSWTGLAEVHCHLCHRHFGSGSTADLAHANSECHDPATVLDSHKRLRLTLVERASGPVWIKRGESDELLALRTATTAQAAR